jgi:GntR family transcriptional regulator
MFFRIDPSNGLAIYDQIVRQVKFAVAHETLKPGEWVPSVRELAQTLAINPNTVARAYRELQTEGVLATVRGSGMEVTPQAPKRCRQERVKLIRERLRGVLTEAQDSRLDHDEIVALLEGELARLKPKK